MFIHIQIPLYLHIHVTSSFIGYDIAEPLIERGPCGALWLMHWAAVSGQSNPVLNFRTQSGVLLDYYNRKYKDYVYRKMLVQEYLKKWRIFKRVKPKNDMMYHDIYNCICQNTKK